MIAPTARRGFTVAETLASLGVLAAAAVPVAALAAAAAGERVRAERAADAHDAVENVLERARAAAWADLSPEWAAAQAWPPHLAERWPGGRLTTTVEAEPGRDRVKRVTAAVTWADGSGRPLTRVGWFAAREGTP